MKLTEIQELIKFVAKSGVNEVEIEQKDFKLVIKSDYLAKKKGGVQDVQPVVAQIPVGMPQQAMAQPVAPQQQPVAQAPQPAAEPAKEAPAQDTSKYIEVKSPMIGTFYRASSPDKPPFVQVGDKIKNGDVVCIIEAMKLFNEIESEVSGTIVKVLVDDSSPIEYDQPLFLVDPA